jgi:putative transposase
MAGATTKGRRFRSVTDRYPRLTLERLPGYAPDLNPVEMVLGHLKHGRMANFVPRHVEHLDQVVRGHLGEVGTCPGLIRSLWAGSRLPFLDKNLAT